MASLPAQTPRLEETPDEAVIVGTIVDSRTVSDRATGLPATRWTVRVERSVRGGFPPEVVITEFGGRVGDRIVVVSHAARYTPGRRYLIFLRQRDDGTLVTADGPSGRLPVLVDADGREWVHLDPAHRLVRQSGSAGLRRLDELVSSLERQPGGNR